MSDEEPVDILPKLTEQCKPKCVVEQKNYLACTDRLKKAHEGDCEPWYFDYLKCIDKCRVPQVFKYVK